MTAELLALKPGESAEEVTAIGGQYDLAPGKYAVQLLRRVSSDPKEGVVKSNTITVTVVPESFSIGISAQKAEVKSGSAISLTVRLTNTSNRVMALPGSPSESADPSYTYSCYSSAGIPVAKHYPIMRSVENHPMNITLKPGESRTQVVPIDSVCSLSKPGNYRIQVSRIDQGEPQHSVVKSNEIKITVKP